MALSSIILLNMASIHSAATGWLPMMVILLNDSDECPTIVFEDDYEYRSLFE